MAAALLIFGGYPLWIGLYSWVSINGKGGIPEDAPPALGNTPSDVLLVGLEGMIQFGILFLIFWGLSRLSWPEIGGTWPRESVSNSAKPKNFWARLSLSIPVGLGYSILLRFGLGIVVYAILVALVSLGWMDGESGANLTPEVDRLVDFEALANDPGYLLVNLTFVSFIFAGFREELWRGASLALLCRLFPRFGASEAGKITMVILLAAVFGLGHVTQGVAGILMTTILGAGLGLIQVFHRSIWEATMAHGFFNASSFLLMRWLPQITESLQALSQP